MPFYSETITEVLMHSLCIEIPTHTKSCVVLCVDVKSQILTRSENLYHTSANATIPNNHLRLS